MKRIAIYILSFLLISGYSATSFGQDIPIDVTNLSGSLGPGSFSTDHDLFVDFTDSLTILPGTTIKFSANKSLTVNGKIKSAGKSDSLIVFKSTGSSTTWNGINFPGSKTAVYLPDQVWKSKFKYANFENVSGQGAIYFTNGNAARAIDSISYCKFSNLNNAIYILFISQTSIVINNCDFSQVGNTGIIIGQSTTVTSLHIQNNKMNNLSNRFLYIYSNSALTTLNIKSNVLDNLFLKKSAIRIENNQTLSSINLLSNEYKNFASDNAILPEECIFYCAGQDNLDLFTFNDKLINSILFNQVLDTADQIISFFYIDYSAAISFDMGDSISDIKNLKHFFVVDECESVEVTGSKFSSIDCSLALFKIVADQSCQVNNNTFTSISTNYGNGCFYFSNVASMDEIVFDNNYFRSITAINGPCLNINSPSGVIESVIFQSNTIEQGDVGFLSNNGGVAYFRLASIDLFKSYDNFIKDCEVTNFGGAYYFDVNSINNLDIYNDTLNNIVANSKGGYISVKNAIYNDEVSINNLKADTCYSKIGSGGIVYLVTQNDNSGDVKIRNCTLNNFHAGNEDGQFTGGGFYIKGTHRVLVFSDNQLRANPSPDEFPVANNGGILFYEHTGASLDSVIIAHNTFSKPDSLVINGSGGAVYLTSTGLVKQFNLAGNVFSKFSAAANGGAIYCSFAGHCESLSLIENSFSGCVADSSGGALFFRSAGIDKLTVSGVEDSRQLFSDCLARHGSGGSLFIHSLSQPIDAIEITYNDLQSYIGSINAAADGGGFYIKSAGNSVKHVIVSENDVNNGNQSLTAGGSGGAFYFYFQGNIDTVDIFNNGINSCEAGVSGGGMYLRSENIGRLTLQGTYAGISHIDNCHAKNGGAFYFDLNGKCDSVSIISKNFNTCVADTSGGAIFFKSNGIGNLDIRGTDEENQEFTSCQAINGFGGSIYINSLSQGIGSIGIEFNDFQSTISGNNAGQDGGAVYIKSAGSDISLISFENNLIGNDTKGLKAGQNGGALYFNLSGGKCNQLNIRNNAIKNCKAVNGSGGGIYFVSNGAGTITIDTNLLLSSGNLINAAIDGGGMYFRTTGSNVNRLALTGNKVDNAGTGLISNSNGGTFFFDFQGICSDLEITDNEIYKSKANNSGGAIYFKTSGGISELKIIGSSGNTQKFSDCVAETGSGGAIFISTFSQPVTSIFIENNEVLSTQAATNAGTNGGGFYLSSAGAQVDEVMVSNNTFGNATFGISAGNHGGAYCIELAGQLGSYQVRDNFFTRCVAGGSGGAAYLKSTGTVEVAFSGSENNYQVFDNCSATGSGGSIYLESNSISIADLSQISFENSSAQFGGAVAFASNIIDDIEFSMANFNSCTATKDGGSVYLTGIGNQAPSIQSYTIVNSIFNQSESETGNGGALYYRGNIGLFDCFASMFSNSTATGSGDGLGAAVYFDILGELENELVFRFDTIQSGNSGSGSVYLHNIGNARFMGSFFVDNYAEEEGAGLFIDNFDTVWITNSLFSQNESALSGGAAIFENGSAAYIGASNFEFNKSVKGGALNLDNFNLSDIDDCRFIQNSTYSGSAASYGGAIYSDNINTLNLNGNTFIRNVASTNSSQTEIQSFGGSLCIFNTSDMVSASNTFQFSEAMVGGAIFSKNTDSGINPVVALENNLFFQNSGIYGGAVYNDLLDQGSLNYTENRFIGNRAGFSGGAIDLRNINKFISTRNIFRKNINEGGNMNGVIGGSALFTLDVSKVYLYNTVFDYNSYAKDTVTDKEPTAWFKDHDSVYIENCTFLDHTPQDKPVIYKDANSEPVYIMNTIFSGNLNPQTPVTNDYAMIEHSYIEGLITEKIDTVNCYTGPAPLFTEGSYILNDDDLDFIDAGNPAEVYNDSIGYPVGKGTERADLGVSGGRFNLWAEEELQVPEATEFTRTIMIERYNGQCGWYKIYFALNEGDIFTNYKWYIFNEIFDTGTESFLIQYFPQDKLIPVTGIATNDDTGMVVTGNNTINTKNEITCKGSMITYAGSDYQCGASIVLNETCPGEVSGIGFKLEELDMPFFSSYKYSWSFADPVGISNQSVDEDSYNEISFTLEMTQDTSSQRSITVIYQGVDTVCDITFEYACTINFQYNNLDDLIELTGVTPPETLLDPGDVFLNIELSGPVYYCNGAAFYMIPDGSVDPVLGIITIKSLASGNTVPIQSINYAAHVFTVYIDLADFSKGEYTIEIGNLCNSCGFHFTTSYPVEIKYEGVDSPKPANITIWPNPANEVIYMDQDGAGEKWQFSLVNALGTVLYQDYLFTGKRYELNVSGLSCGIYFIRFSAADSQEYFYKKIIIE